MPKRICTLILFFTFLSFSKVHAQIDVLQYRFQLTLSDASDTLKGVATITVKFLEDTKSFKLDLASRNHGRGMQVYSVTAHDTTFSITHIQDTLRIQLPKEAKKDAVQTYTITYAGIPADGLIISKNRWNERTFFADNWPNRAHQWLPCNDRPDDKALVEFDVTAPAQYRVISNGVLIEEKAISNNQTYTHWNETRPIPTKVMVIGAARFAVKQFADSSVTPVSAWVYPQDSSKGFRDLAPATAVVKFLSDYIGPYPFEKLANVQSKTIFGGMENAGAIFYAEDEIKGTGQAEDLLAHEIAHQWFGDAATEKSFAHLWLSEGFATYLAHLYLEQTYGRDTLMKRLQADRADVARFAKQWPYPVVDSLSPLMQLLNANSYQKGSWVLHMLRMQVGDTVFKKIMQAYYSRYQFRNADTWDFEKVAEEVSGQELSTFFKQWLFTPGVPELKIRTSIEKDQLIITVNQEQQYLYTFPLEIEVSDDAGHDKKFSNVITSKEQAFTYEVGFPIKHKVVDPDCKLLFTGGLIK